MHSQAYPFPPLSCVVQPNSTSASYHAPSTSMSAKLPNFRRHSYSALNASPNVFHHGERRSMQTIPNTNAVHHSDASTYSSGRSLDSSGVSVGIGEGWASVTSSTRMDADDQRRESTVKKRRDVSRDCYTFVCYYRGGVGSMRGRIRTIRVSYVIYAYFLRGYDRQVIGRRPST